MSAFASRWTQCLPVAILLLTVAGCRSSVPTEPPEAVEPPPGAFHAPVRLEDTERPAGRFYVAPLASTRQGVLFSVSSYLGTSELWRSDGTQVGTFPLGVSALPAFDADTHAAGFILGSEDLRGKLWRLKDDGRSLSSVMEEAPAVQKLGNRYLALTTRSLISLTEEGAQEVLTELVSGVRGPRFVAVVTGRMFFVDGVKRLWVTDGTRAGTRLVHAFGPESEIFEGAAAGSRLVLLVGFSSPSAGGPQPWASDGTPEGTYPIQQLEKYAISTYGTPVLSTESSVVFEASDSTTGIELQATDGTLGSVRTLTDLCEPPGCAAGFKLLAKAGSFAFFYARDATGPWGWRTDGTPEGTLRLVQGDVRAAVAVGDFAYLAGSGLWRTDGTVEGTTALETGGFVQLGEPVEGVLPYIRLSNGGATLRTATGTATRILAEVPLDARILGRTPSHAWVLYSAPGSLFSVDEGTGSKTVLPAPPIAAGTSPSRLMMAQDTLFFRAFNRQGIVDLRASAGSAESTRTVALGQRTTCADCSRRPEPVPMAAVDGTFFFQTAPGTLAAVTADGAQIEVHPSAATEPTVPFHGRLLFISRATSGQGIALWAAEGDGTHTTELFAFPYQMYQSRSPVWFEVSGDRVFLRVWLNYTTDELWTYDEAAGAVLLASYPLTSSLAHALSPSGVTFPCTTPGIGQELCASDGTPDGTVLLGDLRPGEASSEPRDLVRFRDRVYFTADDGVHGRELWVTDGTPEGTRLAFDVLPGPESSELGYLAAGKTQLYFRARSPELGAELWALGLRGPPVPLTDTMPGKRNGLPPRPLAVRNGGDWLVFAARTPENGEELWFSDGTRDGTRLLADLLPGPQSSAPAELRLAPSRLYFRALDATHGPVTWAIGFESEAQSH
jgi:ELWxxDGT repeat protein